MTYYVLKIAVTCVLVVLISEIAQRSSMAGAILASVPIVSVLAMIWLYVDTRDITQVNAFSRSIIWLVLPSLLLFITFPWLTDRGLGFVTSLVISIGVTVAAYFLALSLARALGFES